METVLFFISSTRHTCTNRLEGICRYARTQGWYVQVVDGLAKSGHGCHVFNPGCEQRPHIRQKALAEWLKNPPRPCGIFAANDYVGEEIINICNRLEIPVPQDIAVVGVDNDESVSTSIFIG